MYAHGKAAIKREQSSELELPSVSRLDVKTSRLRLSERKAMLASTFPSESRLDVGNVKKKSAVANHATGYSQSPNWVQPI